MGLLKFEEVEMYAKLTVYLDRDTMQKLKQTAERKSVTPYRVEKQLIEEIKYVQDA